MDVTHARYISPTPSLVHTNLLVRTTVYPDQSVEYRLLKLFDDGGESDVFYLSADEMQFLVRTVMAGRT